ncbi:unnamed protein product, partial [Rotaria sordida]
TITTTTTTTTTTRTTTTTTTTIDLCFACTFAYGAAGVFTCTDFCALPPNPPATCLISTTGACPGAPGSTCSTGVATYTCCCV